MLTGLFVVPSGEVHASLEEQGASVAHVAANVEALRGRDLVCWCRLDHPCHADVLLEISNRPRCEEVAS